MDKKDVSRKEIMEWVQNGKIKPEEGFNLLQRVDQGAAKLLKPNEEISTKLLFKVEWEKSETNFTVPPAQSLGSLIIFDNDGDTRDALQERVMSGELGMDFVVVVKRGAQYRSLGNYMYEINPGKYEDYQELIGSLETQNIVPGKIIHLWSEQSFTGDEADLQSSLADGVLSLFLLSKVLMEHRSKDTINLLYIYPNTKNNFQPQYAGVSGFASTINKENPKFRYKVIETIDLPKVDRIAMMLGEFGIKDDAVAIRYDNGQRYVKRFQEINPPIEIAKTSPFKTNGVYLITGGAGGLGLIFAEHLAKTVKAKLALVDRAELTPQKEAKIQELKAYGAEVFYCQADICRQNEVRDLFAKVKSRFKEINGIIHCAGMVRDAFILKKTKDEFEEVLATKVYGTTWLDQASQVEKLDFFVLFSSIAVMGNVGQSDYAYGNSFMDSFAELRNSLAGDQKRFGKTIAINWPFWQDGEMKVNEKSKELMREFMGIVPLSKETGLMTFEDGLSLPVSQLMVLVGDQQKIRNALQVNPPVQLTAQVGINQDNEANEQPQNIDLRAAPKNRSQAKTELFLKNILAKELKLPASRILSHEPLEKYGINSVMVIGLNQELEAKFGSLPKTLFFEYQNLADLATYFIKNHPEKLPKLIGETSEPQSEKTESKTEEKNTAGINRSRRFLEIDFRREQSPIFSETDIAIIGVNGRYPLAENPEEFWENLQAGRNCVTEIPEDRWDHKRYYHPDKNKVGKSYSKWGGFIKDVDKFDPMFFNISPREAELMDPQERLFLEVVWQAIEDAGYTRSGLGKDKVGVFVGVMYGQYQLYGADKSVSGRGIIPNSSFASIANRVSYYFNFQGPSFALDSMCSSSLTTIHLACLSLQKGESDLAVAGGVNVSIHPNKYLLLSQGKFTSTDGKCRSFGEGGDGYVPGEGVGAVILKPLRKAIADGDNIYAVIKGSSVNHGGKTNGYTVPNPNAQADLISAALLAAKIDPRMISYLEAHGTGTSLGDPIEITGLIKAYRNYTQDKQYCSIGSVKSNIGHLESAAGIAGITKVLLQLKHKQLAPSIHSEHLNPNINFKDSPFYVQQELREWKQPVIVEHGTEKNCPRIAGISAFGAGGSNVHIILEEWENPTGVQVNPNPGPQVFVLSAKNEERLKVYAQKLAAFLGGNAINKPTGNEEALLGNIANDLLMMASLILKVDRSEISLDEDMNEYGFDQNNFIRFAVDINHQYHLEIPPNLFAQFLSIRLVSKYLAEKYQDSFRQYYPDVFQETASGEDEAAQINLMDLAYTLQVGREPMDERLAIIASNRKELIEKLNGFVAVKEDQDNLYHGNIKHNQSKTDLLAEGNAGKGFIKIIIDEGELDKLAILWVSGAEIEWRLLYQNYAPRRISLPTYPFAKERCWIPELGPDQAPVSKLHPLIERNTSTLNEQKFTTELTGKEFFLADNLLGKEKVLPVSATLELALAAGELAREKKVQKLKNISWGQPVSLEKAPLTMQINLFSNGDLIEYEISVENVDSQRTILSQGKLVYESQPGNSIKDELVDIASVKGRCPIVSSGKNCYQLFQTLNLNHGTDFQVIKEIFLGESEGLARLELPAGLEDSATDFLLHPVLMDGAFQTVIRFIAQSNPERGTRFYPLSLGEVELLKPLTESYYAYVTLTPNKSGPDQEKAFEIKLVDETGQVMVRMKDFTVGIVQPKSQTERTPEKPVVSASNSKAEISIRTWIEQDIQKIASDLLKIDPGKLDLQESFGNFGFESVSLKQMADTLSETYRIEINPTVFFAQSNIDGLSNYLLKEFKDDVYKFYDQKINQDQDTAKNDRGPEKEKAGESLERLNLKPLGARFKNLERTAGTNGYSGYQSKEPIAVIGMGGKFPGSKNPDEYWTNLESEQDLITEVPLERWDWRDFHSDFVTGEIKTKSKWGGFISDVDKFDPRFFNISPAEAEMMDPQHRLFMEVVWKAIEDGGYKASDLSGRNVGLFAGVQFNDYQHLLAMQGVSNPMMGLGNEHSIFVNRISYLLNFRGPSEPYNTACSSASVAIHRAVKSIWNGESELAIAGGISLMLSPSTMISADQLGILSPDGRCKTLDKSANGYVKGEGVGAIFLKPLSKAIEDHDYVYAVIKGTSVNHGGKATSLTAPNSDAQAALLVTAYEEAGIDPETITYLELHGTGTELGDPVEIEGIKSAFRQLAQHRGKTISRFNYCGIGSVKTNIGHLEPASGIAGVIKVILALKHKKLPGLLHLRELNPYINLEKTSFYIVKKTKEWERLTDEAGVSIPRRAGVSSFGFGGVNAHVVLEEYENPAPPAELPNQEPHLIVLSAKNEDRLKTYAQEMVSFLEKEFSPQLSLTNIAYTTQIGREEMNERLACLVTGIGELKEKLTEYCQGKTELKNFYRGNIKSKKVDSEFLLEGEDENELIRNFISRKKFDKLAKYWVSGGKVDWWLLYPGQKPYRVPLPTYPFARERYWALRDLKFSHASAPDQPELPSGPAGKPDPIPAPPLEKPAASGNFIESELKKILADKLRLQPEEIEIDENLSEYGLDSIISTYIMQTVQQRFGDAISLTAIVEYPTLRQLAEYISAEAGLEDSLPGPVPDEPVVRPAPTVGKTGKPKLPPEIIPINQKGNYPRSFWVHGAPGFGTFYTGLSEALGPEYPIYAFQARGIDGRTIPHQFYEMVTHYIECMRLVQPEGPYCIGGYSYGGLVAYEMARQLSNQGEKVSSLIMFDSYPKTSEVIDAFYANYEPLFFNILMGNVFANTGKNPAAMITVDDLKGIEPRFQMAYVAKLAKERGGTLPVEEIHNYIRGAKEVSDYSEEGYKIFNPLPYDGSDVLYFKATKGYIGESQWNTKPVNLLGDYDYLEPWRRLIRKNFQVVEVPSDHYNILEEPSVLTVKKHLAELLQRLR
jgi:acyl transferase domain-containing protein/thioesterase domain-containing protein